MTTSTSAATGSCEFTVTRFNANPEGTATVTGRLTAKAAEIKPSVFSPRRIATMSVSCFLVPVNAPSLGVSLEKVNNASTAYKSRYVEIVHDTSYRLCIDVTYIYRNGTLESAPARCNPVE